MTTNATAPSSTPSASSGTQSVLKNWFGTTPTWAAREAILDLAGIHLSPLQMAPLRGLMPNGREAKTVLLSGAEQSGKSTVTAADLLTFTPWIRRDHEGNALE